jgi:osmotically-inducible protein OsmY
MDNAADLRKLVVDELAWDSSIDESGIRVAVASGVVVLTGTVGSYGEKLAAARGAGRVIGVRSVENHLAVRLPEAASPDDRTLFQAAQQALRWHIQVPKERIQVGVQDGLVMLAGTVLWPFQRRAAEHALRHLRGIRGVVNRIQVQPRVTPASVAEKIAAAFQRSAALDARQVRVEVTGGSVTLRGIVSSHAEREAAEQVAWLAPGITDVDNQLHVERSEEASEAGRRVEAGVGRGQEHTPTGRKSMISDSLRSHVGRMLSWRDAHVTFEAAVRDLPADLRGVQPAGLPYSPWQILEHMRLTQLDILAFCRDPDYREPPWPDGYWPPTAEPPGEEAWDASVAAFLRDRAEMAEMAEDASVDLEAPIPHGSGQTYLRELLLVADHNAHHLGELIVLRRLLGAWPAKESATTGGDVG